MTKQRGAYPVSGAPYQKNGDKSELGSRIVCMFTHWDVLFQAREKIWINSIGRDKITDPIVDLWIS